jgi:membrane associated rhomboid family serine protease
MASSHRQRSLPAGLGALSLAALAALAFAWTASHGSPAEPADLVRWGALERSRVWHGELHRLVVAAFLHADWHHLAMNLAGLALAGRPAERALGVRAFLWVYLASVVGGSALSLLGRDAIAVGASAGVFGVFGALLVVHARAMGGWRPFLTSRTGWLALALLVASVIPTVLPGAAWSDVFPTDHLAHAGGFLAGGADALAATAPPPRLRPALLVAAGLLGLVAAAAWPRAGLTAFQGRELSSAIHTALLARDPAQARRLLDEAERGGLRSEALDLYRALALVQGGDLEGGLVALRPLLASGSPPLRDEARRQVAGVARMLGYAHYTGDGRPRDALLGLAYLEEACAAGEAESCSDARRIRGLPPAPTSAP